MKINISLEKRTLENYASLLEQNILPEEIGSYHIISFTGEHAIKSPIKDDPEKYDEQRRTLFNEFKNGIRLNKKGFNTPKMLDAYLEKGKLPFIVMETRIFKSYQELTKKEKNKLKTQYDKQIKLAKKHGFEPEDTNYFFNCGLDKNGKLILHDTEHWRLN